jgi:O-antigen/teichoic acid export membrane protein
LQSILGTFDVFSVTTLRGPDQAALYANTARPVGMAVGLTSSFGSAIMPSFSRYASGKSSEASQRVFVACSRTVLAACGALAIAFVVAYNPLITAWIGAEFVLPPYLVSAIAIAAVSQAWLGFVSFLFGGTGHVTSANVILVIEGLIRIVAMFAGLFFFGFVGLALAAAITQAIAAISYARSLAIINGLRIDWPSLAGLAGEFLVISGTLACAAALSQRPMPLLQAVAMGGLAAVALFGFFALRERELRTFLFTAMRQALGPTGITA